MTKENQGQEKLIQNLREELSELRMREQIKKSEQDSQLY